MAFEVKYSVLDRLIHQLAFSNLSTQFTAADIEETLFNKTYKDIEIDSPIFITSLPRAGTTLLLEALYRLPTLATHIYRDMPFIMAPILWNRISRFFLKRSELKERAHGDGMNVGYDSPEAFEEILWRAFWPEKYSQTHIELWDISDVKEEAMVFISDNMKKIISLRCGDEKKDGRYISKNNANIARLNILKKIFPSSKILIPIRDPFEHATSLLRQHKNFINMHQSEPFIRRYMEDIGHYEFGKLHRPIAFPSLNKGLAKWESTSINYWLAYWVAAYEHVLKHRNLVILISYEKTCSNSLNALHEICEQLSINTDGKIKSIASLFKNPPPARAQLNLIDSSLHNKAKEIYHELLTN